MDILCHQSRILVSAFGNFLDIGILSDRMWRYIELRLGSSLKNTGPRFLNKKRPRTYITGVFFYTQTTRVSRNRRYCTVESLRQIVVFVSIQITRKKLKKHAKKHLQSAFEERNKQSKFNNNIALQGRRKRRGSLVLTPLRCWDYDRSTCLKIACEKARRWGVFSRNVDTRWYRVQSNKYY